MADNRKYYYLKLKENFFDSDSIVLLEDMKDGILYSNILLKLYLKSLKNGGKLQLDGHIPVFVWFRYHFGAVFNAPVPAFSQACAPGVKSGRYCP